LLYRSKVDFKNIQPRKPIQNAYIESFNGRLRDECLNENWFENLKEAKSIVSHASQLKFASNQLKLTFKRVEF